MRRVLSTVLLGVFLAVSLAVTASAEMVSFPNTPKKCPFCKVTYDRYGFITKIIHPKEGEWELKPKGRVMVDYVTYSVSDEYKYTGPAGAFKPFEPLPKKAKVKKAKKDKKKDKDGDEASTSTSGGESCGMTPTVESCDQ